MNWHRTQATILVDAGVEMLAFETFPALKEAEAVVQLLREFPSCKAWISFSCKVSPRVLRFIPGFKCQLAATEFAQCELYLRESSQSLSIPYFTFGLSCPFKDYLLLSAVG